jgi:hypothetical protein
LAAAAAAFTAAIIAAADNPEEEKEEKKEEEKGSRRQSRSIQKVLKENEEMDETKFRVTTNKLALRACKQLSYK